MAGLFFENDGGRISYEEQGGGPLVVCVPGIGDLRGEYRFLAPQLAAAGFRAASMDLRGHGESSTAWEDFTVAGVGRDILALIRALNAGPAVVVGTSMGAGAAVWAAAEAAAAEADAEAAAPEAGGSETAARSQVAGLVLIGPSVHGDVSTANRLLYASLFARPWGPSVWVKYLAKLFPTRKPGDFAAYSAALQANLKQPGRMEAFRGMIYASKAASEARLGRVRAPALIVMGDKDPDFKNPENEARWVADHLRPGGALVEYRMISGAGHYPHVEMPEETAELVTAFCRRISADGGPEAEVQSRRNAEFF